MLRMIPRNNYRVYRISNVLSFDAWKMACFEL